MIITAGNLSESRNALDLARTDGKMVVKNILFWRGGGGGHGHLNVGSITSRCSGKEPALLPRTHGWTRGHDIVNFNQ